jgi:hypothetical protein
LKVEDGMSFIVAGCVLLVAVLVGVLLDVTDGDRQQKAQELHIR